MTNGNASYDARDIKVLEGLEAVRKRPSMYIGSTGPRGLHHLVWEVVDNSVDEAMAGFATRIDVSLLADGGVRVVDDGRGIPVDFHPKTKQSALTVVLGTLHAGGKFEQGAYTVSGGLHGVGVSVVNALASHLSAEIRRDGFVWGQIFQRGKALTKVEKLKPWKKNTGHHDQLLAGQPDLHRHHWSSTTTPSPAVCVSWPISIAVWRSSLHDERPPDDGEEPRADLFHFKGGLLDFVKHLNANREPVHAHVVEIDRSLGRSRVGAGDAMDRHLYRVDSFLRQQHQHA